MYLPQRTPRGIARLGLGLMMLIPALGATASHARAADPLTLTVQDWVTADAISTIYQPCEAKLNVKVKFSFVPRTGYETKLQTQFASGTAPDIYDAPPEEVLYYGNKGQALDQVPYLKQLGLPYNKVVSQAQFWDAGKVGTKLYAQAQGAQSMYLFYNKDVFAKAGVAAPPSTAATAWTWPQFVAVAKKLTVDRNGKHPDDPGFDTKHIQRYGVNINLWYGGILPLVWSNNGSDFDIANKKFTLNQPAGAQAMQAIADLALKDHVMPTPSQLSTGAGSISLASGRLGMELNGNWQVYFNTHPKQTFQFGIGVLPKFKQYRAFYFAGSGYVVSSKTAHPKEAVQFDDCMTYQGLDNYKTGLWVPSANDLLYGAGASSWISTSFHPSNYRSVVIDTIKTSLTPPFNALTEFGPTWTNVLTPAISRIMAGEPAQQVLNSVKPQVDALLAHG